ncbi:MAG: glycoside hydrolase family 130 protein [Clostridia bacterium]|nr:glycoside hydrolase family 130 protein [Clostridia bacterium]
MPAVTPILTTHPCIRKRETPVMQPADLPYPCSLVFNAGVIKYRDEYVMVFRNDYGTDRSAYENENRKFTGTSVGIARSKNGIDGWRFDPQPLIDSNDPDKDPELKRLYDPRIVRIEDKLLLCLAMDTRHGICGAIAELSEDLRSYRIISSSVPENRNMVLFPEKINGEYVRLERPMPVYSRGRDCFDIWLSRSPDLIYWGRSALVLGVEDVPWANDKIGPTASPIKTERGWLTLFHAVDKDELRGKNGWEKQWKKRYTAGLMLLDLHDPTKVISLYREPLIAPDRPIETDEGFRQNAIFPCGMLLEDSGEVKIYYGAADACVCLATADVNDLLRLLP